MEDLRKELEDLMVVYIGSMVTEEMIVSLRDDLLAVVGRYLEGYIDYAIRVERDEEDPSVVGVTLVFDGSVIRSIFDLSQLPKYLAHELKAVRDLATERLGELTRVRP